MKSLQTALTMLLSMIATNVQAQTFDEKFDLWPVNLKINGTIIAVGGGEVPSDLHEDIVRYAGNDKATFVILTFKNHSEETTDSETVSFLDEKIPQTVFQIGEKSETDVGSLTKAIKNATGVIMIGDGQSPEGQFLWSEIHKDLTNLIRRGGVILTNGKIATQLGRKCESDRNLTTDPASLIPDCVLITDYDHQRDFESFSATLAETPRFVGIGVQSNTAIVLRGRKIRIVGEGAATFALMKNDRKPLRVQHVREAKSRRANPYETIIDLTAWRRDAIDRTVDQFPAEHPQTPYVEKGTLFIVGGGKTPSGLMDRMVELAGGKDAHMVYIPCSEQDQVSPKQRIVETWKKMGVASAITLHTKDRMKANSDQEFLEPLIQATGLWFGGGRQWNFADSYYGTEAHRLMKEVLHRGGVIGGSSAGASIQGRYMCRANPVANYDIMAPGYERGLGFLSGVAIDQHFTQRGRLKDMTQLVNQYPQLLGIGLDESTAIIVRKSKADVVGEGKAFFYDRINHSVNTADKDYIALEAGSSFDLDKRRVIENNDK